jgi:hypothetical protein
MDTLFGGQHGTGGGRVIRTLYSWAMWALQPVLRRKLQRRGREEPG